MENQGKVCAVIVAAGKGTRMKSDCPKQFLMVRGKPVLYYTLKAFEDSSIDEVIIVTSKDYVSYVENEIVLKYDCHKVIKVVVGGKERYESVYHGLMAMEGVNYVLVHDGARPFITSKLIDCVIQAVKEEKAVVVGVKSKDTVKLIDSEGYVQATPNREQVWNIQTPQAFEYDLLKDAYDKVIAESYFAVTDDAMVVEYASKHAIKVIEGSYQNIKITTPEDLKMFELGELFAD